MSVPAVIQLQEYATDEQHDVSNLLRKALLVATKLKLSDFREWLSSELDGYHNKNLLPKYRIISGQLKAQNPYHGLIPYIIEDPEMAEAFSRITIGESISSLHDLVNQTQSEQGRTIVFPLSSELESLLMRMQKSIAPLQPTRTVGTNQIVSIINTVRTRILEWALALEEEGILGEGLTFSSKEKEIAENSMTINNIGNFQGVLGNVSESTVTQTNHFVVNSGDFNSLAEHLRSQRVEQQDIAELHQAIKNDPNPTQPNALGSHVSAWMGKMVTKAADGSWNVGIGAAGGLLATALSKYYGF